ncbi:unnamed protein product [Eruca vesicaria subsp. sativa]|uniref:F-box domain-containing protein n=1 Tax=Eruca vesicaria subsp. sativa TaxID=29727 RepID=A0ABC8LJD9_ERUVS|nr:unnamed protein product [Eruca vesicaria subsp. sativa]
MSEVTSSVKISRRGGKESKDIPGCGQVSQECGAINDKQYNNIWLEGDHGFPIRERSFPKLRKIENTVDKKYGLCYTRKKIHNTMMMSDLPDDLLEEILCRIEATSLKRLQSTCKRWNLLINSKRFTIKHFDKAAKQSLSLMLNVDGVYTVKFHLHRSPHVEVTGEIDLIYPHPSFDKRSIAEYCHSDGLLLCVCVNDVSNISNEDFGFVVWNPCTGQTKCIQPRYPCRLGYTYSLGSYKNKKSNDSCYKILSHTGCDKNYEFDIYEVSSNSCRTLDVTLDCNFEFCRNVSLKGKTYWFASDEKTIQLGIFLVFFDYITETFGRLTLPYQYVEYQTMSLSVVGEEKLSVLLQHEVSSKTEIWVTKMIGETKVVSWIKVLAVDLKPGLQTLDCVNFLVDEEKKVLVYTAYVEEKGQHMGYIVGEDNEVIEVALGPELSPFLLNYVPSLTQIQLHANLSI